MQTMLIKVRGVQIVFETLSEKTKRLEMVKPNPSQIPVHPSLGSFPFLCPRINQRGCLSSSGRKSPRLITKFTCLHSVFATTDAARNRIDRQLPRFTCVGMEVHVVVVEFWEQRRSEIRPQFSVYKFWHVAVWAFWIDMNWMLELGLAWESVQLAQGDGKNPRTTRRGCL